LERVSFGHYEGKVKRGISAWPPTLKVALEIFSDAEVAITIVVDCCGAHWLWLGRVEANRRLARANRRWTKFESEA
jgi:hypothetical protein